jgi:ABC-type dipeptide/oligopeptide/nickel transport system permease component
MQSSLSVEARAKIRQDLGLDQPLPVQYIRWLGRMVHGDLGTSVRRDRPVLEMIGERLPNTFLLVAFGTAIALLVALPLGFLGALHQGTLFDRMVTASSLVGLSIPDFALGTTLALVFGVWLRLLPTAGHPLLPAIVLGTMTTGLLTRTVRSSVLDELARDYVRTAAGKGLRPGAVRWWHITPNALPVTVGVLGALVGIQLGGSIVVEQVFGWPGLGLLFFDAITGRDYPVMQGIAILTALLVLTVRSVADVIQLRLNPRVR